MRSSFASRLKAFSPPQLAMVALGSLVLAGAGTAAAAGLLAGVTTREQAFTGGDQDMGRVAITQGDGNVAREPVPAEKTSDAPAPTRASNDRRVAAVAPSRERTKPIAGNGSTPVPAGGDRPSDASGPEGNTGAAGPKGDTGAAGPTPEPGNGAAGAPGPKGDTGSGGPTGAPAPKDPASPGPQSAPGAAAAPAPTVFIVRDADGTTAGMLVGEDPSAGWLAFSYKQRSFIANARTGALDLPKVDTSYATDDCTGTAYAPLSRPADSVLRSVNPNEVGIYEFGQRGSLDVRSIWQTEEGGPGDCLRYVYTNSDLAPLHELSASDLPPTLNGPLKSVRSS